MVLLKTVMIAVLFSIFYQDLKERKVYWFLFPLVAVVSGLLFYNNTLRELFTRNVLINLAFTAFLLIVVYFYSKWKLKTSPKHVFGLGDTLLFICLAFSFASISFITLFVFSLIFSLVLHLILREKQKNKTVPLAGYMSLFFMLVYLSYWSGITTNLYSL